jgi:hypothetical protein
MPIIQRYFTHTKIQLPLQHHLNHFGKWLKQWRIKSNENKSTHVTFSLKRETCPAVTLNGQHIPQEEPDKYRRSPPRPPADMATTHIHQKKTSWFETSPHVLDHRKEVRAITRKQNTNLQNYPKAYLDVRHTLLGHSK